MNNSYVFTPIADISRTDESVPIWTWIGDDSYITAAPAEALLPSRIRQAGDADCRILDIRDIRDTAISYRQRLYAPT